MTFGKYEMSEPRADSAVGSVLRSMALKTPQKTSRLITALEEFVWNGPEAGHRVLPEEAGAPFEIYLVPPRYVLSIPDAAALVHVDHNKASIEIVHIVREYGGPGEKLQWLEICQIAGKIMGPSS